MRKMIMVLVSIFFLGLMSCQQDPSSNDPFYGVPKERKNICCPLGYPETTGNIEFAGVLPRARGKGVAKKLLKEITENNPKYTEFILDVTDTEYFGGKMLYGFRLYRV